MLFHDLLQHPLIAVHHDRHAGNLGITGLAHRQTINIKAPGGEQSGHIVLADYGTTGDGLVAALQVLAVIQQSGRPASVSRVREWESEAAGSCSTARRRGRAPARDR
mgnify:CR=1 FL=1